jgi:hypothetical protein
MYSPELFLGASFDIIVCQRVVQTHFPNLIVREGGSDLRLLAICLIMLYLNINRA